MLMIRISVDVVVTVPVSTVSFDSIEHLCSYHIVYRYIVHIVYRLDYDQSASS